MSNCMVSAFLQQNGLAQYADVVIANGFEDMNTFLEITESDLQELKFPVGHERKLLVAIEKMKTEAKTAMKPEHDDRKRRRLEALEEQASPEKVQEAVEAGASFKEFLAAGVLLLNRGPAP